MNRINLLLVWLMTSLVLTGCRKSGSQDLTMVVGTYTGGSSEGMYVYRFNTADLSSTLLGKTVVDNPSYLAITPDAKFVYAVSESGEANSAVSAFAFDKESGGLTFLNKQKVEPDPCFILLDKECRFVITANYSGGSVSVVPLAADGRLASGEQVLQFYGSGTDTVRQAKPHLHCVAASPATQTLFGTDLGTDHIYQINIRTEEEKGLPYPDTNESFDTELAPGSGPRHLTFNKKGTHAYLINELSGYVTVFRADANDRFEEIQSVVADTCYAGGSADIHLSPDEKYLYTSTRLKGDGIVVFKVNQDGTVERKGYQATGKHPRNFAITPDGNLMLVACKDSGMIQIFRIDKQTGMLNDTGKGISVDQPVCIKFAE